MRKPSKVLFRLFLVLHLLSLATVNLGDRPYWGMDLVTLLCRLVNLVIVCDSFGLQEMENDCP